MSSDLGVAEDLDVLDRLVEAAGRTVIDAGCGAGAMSRHLAQRGACVIALEPDPEQAAANREALDGVDGIAFHQTGAESMPCDDGAADLVIFGKSLHHVPQPLMAAALAEAQRVLGSDGRLYVLEPEVEGSFSDVMRPFHDERQVREAAKAALAAEAVPRFAHHETVRYRNLRRYADFEAFVRAMCGATYNDVARRRVDTEEVRRRFESGRCDGGYAFEQPMRVDLFRAPSTP